MVTVLTLNLKQMLLFCSAQGQECKKRFSQNGVFDGSGRKTKNNFNTEYKYEQY